MKRYLASACLLTALSLSQWASAQNLSDLLVSLKNRQRVLMQQEDMVQYVQDPTTPLGENATKPIQWLSPVGTNESSADSQPIDVRIGLLNQAIAEFDRCKLSFLNVRAEDLASSTSPQLGALRPFLSSDFDPLPRVTPENYYPVLAELSRRVRRLKVLPWSFSLTDTSWSHYDSGSGGSGPLATGLPTTDEISEQSVRPGYYLFVGNILISGNFYQGYEESLFIFLGAAGSQADDDPVTWKLDVTENYASQVKLSSATSRGQKELGGAVSILAQTTPSVAEGVQANASGAKGWNFNDPSWICLGSATSSQTINLPDPKLTASGSWPNQKFLQTGRSSNPAPSSVEAGSNAGVSEGYKLGSRHLMAVFAPDFKAAGGIDAEAYNNLETAANVLSGSPPEGELTLHPWGDVLYQIDLGVGFDGKGSGMLVANASTNYSISSTQTSDLGNLSIYFPQGLSIYYQDQGGPRRGVRFDYGANLRFSGSADDFQVVYENDRHDSDYRAEIPTTSWQNFDESGNPVTSGNGRYSPAITLATWDLPHVTQIIGRDILADITYSGHYASEIKIYRRPKSAGVSRATALHPNERITVGSDYKLIRTYNVHNPNVTDDSTYITAATTGISEYREKLAIEDSASGASYEISRDVLNASGDTISFLTKEGGSNISSEIIHNQSSSSENSTVTRSLDGNSLGEWTLSPDWNWLRIKPAALSSHQVANISTTVNSTMPAQGTDGSYHAASRGGILPTKVVITRTNNLETTLEWNQNGLLTKSQRGTNLYKTDPSGGVSGSTVTGGNYIGDSKINSVWVDLSTSGSLKVSEGRTPGATSAGAGPDQVVSSETVFGGTGGLPGLPSLIKYQDGTATQIKYEPGSGGGFDLKTKSGLLAGSQVSNGVEDRFSLNGHGYVTGASSTLSLGSASLKLSGYQSATDVETDWGAPTKLTDDTTGLSTTFTYSGNRNLLSQVTGPTGVVSSFSSYDSLDRLKTYSWNGGSGQLNYLPDGQFGVYNKLTLASVDHESTVKTDAVGRVSKVVNQGREKSEINVVRESATSAKITSTGSIKPSGSSSFAEVGNVTSHVNASDGVATNSSGNVIPFGDRTGEIVDINGGLVHSKTYVTDYSSVATETWSDAQGRVRKVTGPSATGSGTETTEITYGDFGTPASYLTTASPKDEGEGGTQAGLTTQTESDPWNSSGMVSTSGVKVSGTGFFSSNDRYVKSVTKISGAVLRTSVYQNEDSGERELVRTDYDPTSGKTTTLVNPSGSGGYEQQIVCEPTFTNNTVKVTTSKGGVRTFIYSSLGQLESVGRPAVGGLPDVNFDPTWRADGSLSGISLKMGGVNGISQSAAVDANGLVSSVTLPGLGTIPVTTSVTGDQTHTSVNGTTTTTQLDGTYVNTSGQVMEKSSSLTLGSGGFTETISPNSVGSGMTNKYNFAGALTLKQYSDGATPDQSFTWLKGGLLKSRSIQRGGSVSYTYAGDGSRDLSTVSFPQVNSGVGVIPSSQNSFTFNRASRLKTVTDASGGRTYGYNSGHLSNVAYGSGLLSGYSIGYTPDTYGNRSSVTLSGPAAFAVNYVPDGNSGAIGGLNDGSGFAVSYSKDPSKQVTEIVRGSVHQYWDRDAATGRVTGARATFGTSTAIAPSFSYTQFDAYGRRKNVTVNGVLWTYNYDGVNGQLNSATFGSQAFTYNFDAAGRRSGPAADPLNQFKTLVHGSPVNLIVTSATPGRLWINDVEVPSYSGYASYSLGVPSGTQGQWVGWKVLASKTGGGQAGANPNAEATTSGYAWVPPETETFTYDNDGNRVSSALWDYGWDGKNDLVAAKTKNYSISPEGWDITFAYDSSGRRVNKHVVHKTTINGQPMETVQDTIFVWDGWNLLYERCRDAGYQTIFERKYIWGYDISGGLDGVSGAGGAGGLLLMRETRSSGTTDYYPLYDGSGHVTAVCTTAGTVVANYTYGPFGEIIAKSGRLADSNPWRYATKYYDTETGLSYFGRRYFDSVSGQWLSREPLGEGESLNLYSYCHNDPINNSDILGLEAIDIKGDEAALKKQYQEAMDIVRGVARPGGISDAELEAAYDQFVQKYTAYLSGVKDLQGKVTANEVSDNDMWQGWWNNHELEANRNVAFGFPIVPEEEGGASVIPRETLRKALFFSAQYSSIISNKYQSDSDYADVISSELQKTQARVNYISLALGVGSALNTAGEIAVVKGGGAAVGYLTRTAGGYLVSYAGSAAVEYGIDKAQEKGMITKDQAYATRMGISLFQILLAKKQLAAEKAKGAGGGPFCFPAGTPVLMADGSAKPIEEIGEGDWVLAEDPQPGVTATSKRVTHLHRNWTEWLTTIEIDQNLDGVCDGKIKATGQHPFWTQNRGWVNAHDLKTGDVLLDAGQGAPVVLKRSEEQTISLTFNLTVEDSHTFFVKAGSASVLVHNMNPGNRLYVLYQAQLSNGTWYTGYASKADPAGLLTPEDVMRYRFKGGHHRGIDLESARIRFSIWGGGRGSDAYSAIRGAELLFHKRAVDERVVAKQNRPIADSNPKAAEYIEAAEDLGAVPCER